MANYKKWRDIRAKKVSPDKLAKLDREIERELLEMDLRAVRETIGKTQTEIAEATAMSQGEVSRLEQRRDHLVSTLRRYVEALGGELEIVASFGDKRVRLRAAG